MLTLAMLGCSGMQITDCPQYKFKTNAQSWETREQSPEMKACLEKVAEQKKHLKERIPSKAYINSIGMKFVLVQPGAFMMGSQNAGYCQLAKELGNRLEASDLCMHPRHCVEITRPFYISKVSITQDQWSRLMGSNPQSKSESGRWYDPGQVGKDLPVTLFSSKLVFEFIDKLNQKEKTNKYRLPTEAEWEYAAKADDDDDLIPGCDDDYNRTSYIGMEKKRRQKEGNNWGLIFSRSFTQDNGSGGGYYHYFSPVIDPLFRSNNGYFVIKGEHQNTVSSDDSNYGEVILVLDL